MFELDSWKKVGAFIMTTVFVASLHSLFYVVTLLGHSIHLIMTSLLQPTQT